MSFKATAQSDNVVPGRIGSIWPQAVDATSRPYNISLLPFGGKALVNSNEIDHIYLTMTADGGDVYFAFGSVTGTVDDTAGNAAGVALTATTMSVGTTFAQKIPNGTTVSLRIERRLDKWLMLKTSAGTATLRVNASSQGEI